MGIYDVKVDEVGRPLSDKITVVADVDALNRRIAAEFGDLLEEKTQRGELLTILAPVGALDYRYFVKEAERRGLSCANLRSINMDEYLDDSGDWIPKTHPLSFRRFMDETFFSLLPQKNRPKPENIVFPDPTDPDAVTQLIDEIGGADVFWSGFGISGHVAFNDPPVMLGEPDDLESFRQSRTRAIEIGEMSTTQMLMGATDGNSEILPRRAVTLGMYEILRTKRMHLTFMRNWHAGVWRRALLGPVTQRFPGSLTQTHPNLAITMTELAAALPRVNTLQATGEHA